MRHVHEGVLRQLVDEPMAVSDRAAEHVLGCERCQAHRTRVLQDVGTARRLLARPQPVPDLDRAWERFSQAGSEPRRRVPKRIRPRPRPLAGAGAGAAGIAVASGTLVAGVAAAATLTVVFAPTQVAPLPVSKGDLQSLTSALGLGNAGLLHHRSVRAKATGTTRSTPPSTTPTGPTRPTTSTTGTPRTRTWAYGTIRWATRPTTEKTTSLAEAEAASGMSVHLPGALPNGVQGSPTFEVVRRSSAIVTFDAKAGPSLAGSTLTVSIGPGVLADYGGATNLGAASGTRNLADLPTLVVAEMERPLVTSTGATITALESFVLQRPGFPQDLAEEIRLLGNLKGTLPLPVPAGVTRSSAMIGGDPAVVLSMAGGTATAVVWEDHDVVRTVGGLLNQQDVLSVARQLG